MDRLRLILPGHRHRMELPNVEIAYNDGWCNRPECDEARRQREAEQSFNRYYDAHKGHSDWYRRGRRG